jgi:O-antigen ligase
MTMSVPGRESWKPAPVTGGRQGLRATRAGRGTATWGFRLVMLYLLLEFGRPQELNSVIAALSLPLVTTLLLVATLACSGRLVPALRQTRAFQILLVLMALHVPLAVNNYWAFTLTLTMAQTFVLYLGIVTFVDSEKKLRTAVGMWIGVHVFLALHVMLHNGRGVGGFLGDENDVAMTLDMIVPVAFFLAVQRSAGARRRLLMAAALLFVVMIVPLTMSRGGLVGLVAVVLYCALRSPRKLTAAAIVLALGLLLVVYAPEGYWARMQTILWPTAEDDSGTQRIYAWQVGWKMFLSNPVLGVGPGNFPWRFSEYEGALRWNDRSLAGRAAHSVYLTLLSELGLLGLTLVATMVIGACRGLVLVRRLDRRASNPSRRGSDMFTTSLSLALEGSLFGFLVASAFITTLYYPNLWVLLGFMEALRQLTIVRETDEFP